MTRTNESFRQKRATSPKATQWSVYDPMNPKPLRVEKVKKSQERWHALDPVSYLSSPESRFYKTSRSSAPVSPKPTSPMLAPLPAPSTTTNTTTTTTSSSSSSSFSSSSSSAVSFSFPGPLSFEQQPQQQEQSLFGPSPACGFPLSASFFASSPSSAPSPVSRPPFGPGPGPEAEADQLSDFLHLHGGDIFSAIADLPTSSHFVSDPNVSNDSSCSSSTSSSSSASSDPSSQHHHQALVFDGYGHKDSSVASGKRPTLFSSRSTSLFSTASFSFVFSTNFAPAI